ncbi:unnamed protein product [Closterium sp. Yama58-4]|nr:unnamed protein product [Closterium sp. Yama58-4]
MAEPRSILFLLRLLVAWVTYYTVFHETIAKSFVGMIEVGIIDDHNESSSSGGEDSGENRRHRARVRRQRFQMWVDDLQHMRDMFRINRAILEHIKVGMRHCMEPVVERTRITIDTALLVAINYLASGISYVDMSYMFDISKTLCHELIDIFLKEFPAVYKADWVRFPTRDELQEMEAEFCAIKGVPVVVGAIDGTHIYMKGMEGHQAEYWTRKSTYAMQLQVTCDARGIMWDYLIGYPGSAHNQRVLKNSATRKPVLRERRKRLGEESTRNGGYRILTSVVGAAHLYLNIVLSRVNRVGVATLAARMNCILSFGFWRGGSGGGADAARGSGGPSLNSARVDWGGGDSAIRSWARRKSCCIHL